MGVVGKPALTRVISVSVSREGSWAEPPRGLGSGEGLRGPMGRDWLEELRDSGLEYGSTMVLGAGDCARKVDGVADLWLS